jgi:oligosaccharide repeat unit polymerase
MFGTWITPFSFLSFPYTVIVMMAFLLGPTLGFIPLYVESVLIWIVGLLLFWIGGLIIALPLGKTIRSKEKRNQSFLYEEASEKWVLMFSWLTIFVLIYATINSINLLGFHALGSDDFAKSYGYGFAGHVKNFSIGLFIFLVGTARRDNVFGLFTMSILIGMYFLYPVKSWLIIPVLAGLIYRVLSSRYKLSIFKILLPLFLGFIIFIISYLIEFGAKNIETIYNIEVYEQLLKHFLAYIFGGILALGEVVRTKIANFHGNSHVIFAPFVNLYSVIFSGDLISHGSHTFSVISLDGIKKSNVHTFFGTLLINLGYFSTMIYVIYSGFIAYVLFALAKVTRNCWFIVTWSFIGVMLSLGWFEYYFWLLAAIEVPTYCAILGFLFWLLGHRYSKRRYSLKLFVSNPTI